MYNISQERKELIIATEFKLLSIFMCSIIAKPKIASLLNHNDFVSNVHQTIFSSILNLYNQGKEVDSVTLIYYLMNNNLLAKAGGKEYIQKMYAEYIGDSFFLNYVDFISETSNKAKLKSLSSFIDVQLQNDKLESTTIITDIDSKLQDLFNRTNEKDFQHVRDASEIVFDRIHKLSESTSSITGLTSGYTEVDSLTSGFQLGDLIILAARPSMGKTALALNFALNLLTSERAQKVQEQSGIVFFSLEMPCIQLLSRLYSVLGKIDLQKITTGKNLNQSEWGRINKIHSLTKDLEIYFDDTSSLSIMKLQLRLKKICKEKPHIKFVIIDYLQLLSLEVENRNESRQQEISKISRYLKVLARQLNVTIMCLSQLSRATERREDKRPLMSDLRDSGSIEQDADLVMLLYRESYYEAISNVHNDSNYSSQPNKSTSDITELILVKNRNGPIGKVFLEFHKNFGKFEKNKN